MNFNIARRKLLVLLGAVAIAGRSYAQSGSVAAPAKLRSPACTVTPEQTEGPYFVDTQLNRSDIRSDPADGSVRAGVPLSLALRVTSVGGTGCAPLAGAIVDIWHCDAAGDYSGVGDTAGRKFLRGYQIADASGGVGFTTIYPGWYRGRAVHIHFKVRAKSKTGRQYEFTSQFYFDDAVTDRIYAHPAYASAGRRRQKNDADGLFRHGGRQLMLVPIERVQGYAAAFDIGLEMA